MNNITEQRCFNHLHREAVARCPECGRCFCRECVTEHDDRVICAACLRRTLAPAAGRQPILQRVMLLAHFCLGFMALWMLAYYLGRMLLLLPDSFHEGNLWPHLRGD
jgi:hypothetical protein